VLIAWVQFELEQSKPFKAGRQNGSARINPLVTSISSVLVHFSSPSFFESSSLLPAAASWQSDT
jgi:hypothetical protein